MKVLIIDDELAAVNNLKILLHQFCPVVTEIIGTTQVDEGLHMISANDIDILFTDVEMPGLTGIQLIEAIDGTNIDVVVVSAHSKFAIDAISLSVSGYLLKSVEIQRLIMLVNKIHQNRSRRHIAVKTSNIPLDDKVAMPLGEGVEFIKVSDIIMVHAEGSYSKIYFTNRTSVLMSKNLKYLEELLVDRNFFRVHRSALINMNSIVKYKPHKDGGTIVMQNGIEVDLARSQKIEFSELIRQTKIGRI